MEKKLGSVCAVRPLAAGDVTTVWGITARSPEAAQWSREDYERVCRGEFDGWVAECGAQLAGFLIARRMADEMEILNLAVEPEWRRRGVASRMLEALLAFGRAWGARKAFLEVRASNARAIAFYRRFGFSLTGRRVTYYSDPIEDALVLSRELS